MGVRVSFTPYQLLERIQSENKIGRIQSRVTIFEVKGGNVPSKSLPYSIQKDAKDSIMCKVLKTRHPTTLLITLLGAQGDRARQQRTTNLTIGGHVWWKCID